MLENVSTHRFLFLFFEVFIWLHQILVAAYKLLAVACGL